MQKWFELAGVVPLAVFVLVHVASYAGALFGLTSFGVADRGSVLGLALGMGLIWLPLAFHAGYGLKLSTRALEVDAAERRASLGLRWSGAGLLVFLVGHAGWLAWPLWRGERNAEDVYGMLAAGLSSTAYGVPWLAVGHLAGLGLVALHLGLGLDRFGARWGLLRGRRSRRLARGLAVMVFVLGAASVVELATGSALPRFLH